ncbi:OBAP family protein [Haliangium ochraceum]
MAEGQQVQPPGDETTTKTDVLKAGAEVLQSNSPTDKLDVYVVGFHPMKNDPGHQMEAHHFCRQVNEDFAQCALYDSGEADANLNGIEYIISEKLYETLPEGEKPYWHPHNYEILSGQLIAPGLPEVAETELMKGKMNSYGKTWHTWFTGGGAHDGQKLPLGEPQLAWSINADGEVDPALVEKRDHSLDVSTEDTRAERQALVEMARPQRGVDALADAFPERSKPAGVIDADAQ